MPRETETLKLLRTLQGLYKPSSEEVCKLAGIAKLNKLYLAYLRRVGDALGSELIREEAKYRWFIRNVAGVVEVLESTGANYTLYKFRRPFEHVSVDLDILVRVEDVPRVVRALVSRGFKVVAWEPYTVTLARCGFIVDLYTYPSFAWVVYMDGEELLRCCAEEIEIGRVRASALTREAEAVVAAAHAVYKEHMVLLIDCLTMWAWTGKSTWSLANKLDASKALETLHSTCRAIGAGYAEAPHKLKLYIVAEVLFKKFLKDAAFRTTILNVFRYVLSQREAGTKILSRLIRISY